MRLAPNIWTSHERMISGGRQAPSGRHFETAVARRTLSNCEIGDNGQQRHLLSRPTKRFVIHRTIKKEPSQIPTNPQGVTRASNDSPKANIDNDWEEIKSANDK
jgi:hypothetical protein